MCNQSVGLIAGVIEKSGMATVCLSLLREVTEKVRPPRSLYVDFPFGYPLGAPADPALQHRSETSHFQGAPCFATPERQGHKGPPLPTAVRVFRILEGAAVMRCDG
jgi:hypothetical protein